MAFVFGSCSKSELHIEREETTTEPAALTVKLSSTPKMSGSETNTLLDFMFCADPTAVVHDGRLYVYGTNDHQQYEGSTTNDYGRIKSLVMMSTTDMVNWTYHGTIDVGKVAPWIANSWAPSVVSKRAADGSTNFYLYFSNSGGGVGVLTASSPVGPWSDPLGKNLVGVGMNNIYDGMLPFDPGAVIDDNGTGWLAFGGGVSSNGGTDYMPLSSRIAKLNDDMLSFVSDFVTIKAPSFNEASELNYINGTWVYTFCNRWDINDTWTDGSEKPGVCSMCYMTSTSPLDTDSWTYKGTYLLNPGDAGLTWGNNHSHLQKYKGKYYIFYHTQCLQSYFGVDGGFRNIAVDEISVNEQTVSIAKTKGTTKGASQIENVNPFEKQQAEMVSATSNVAFEAAENTGNMVVVSKSGNTCLRVSGVNFTSQPKTFAALVSGSGGMDVRIDSPTGARVAILRFNRSGFGTESADITKQLSGVHDLYFILGDGTVRFDEWQFMR